MTGAATVPLDPPPLDPACWPYDAFCRDPFPLWALLRRDHPLWHNEAARVWQLTRYEDVVAVFRDNETYSNRVYEHSLGKVFGPTMLQMDGREHVVRRTIVAPEVVGKRLGAYQELIERNARALIDRFVGRGEADLVADFSTWLPVNVICDMLGLPAAELPFFHDCYQAMMVGLGQDPELRRRGIAAHQALAASVAPLIEVRRADPGPDLISKIVHAECDGQRLSDEEVQAFVSLMLTAGGETTDKAIANLWVNLLSDRDQLAAVREDPELLDAAFSETMRHSFPVISQVRLVARDVGWHGRTVPAGAVLNISIGSANNDDDVFEDPRRFDLHRRDLWLAKELRRGVGEGGRCGHLGFGLGKHFCLGYEMARAEAVIGARLLLDACPDLRLAGEPPPLAITGQTRSCATLPVRF